MASASRPVIVRKFSRDWERGRKRPGAPARPYLTMIARNSEFVAGLLGEAA
jgi:DNA-binding transcriptional regulator YiaG